MGWKLGLAVMDVGDQSLSTCVATLYGTKAELGVEPISVEDAQTASWLEERRFLAKRGNQLLVFDFLLSAKLCEQPELGPPDFASFQLVSTVNGYAYTIVRDSHVVRSRYGTADDGIVTDIGRLLPTEIASIHACATPPKRDAALQVWTTPDLFLSLNDDEEDLYTHDALGEEVVFALVGERLGERPDVRDAWLRDVQAFEVVTSKGGWWPFR